MKRFRFDWDERLQIHTPVLLCEWEHLSAQEQYKLLMQWEIIRGRIPDRIFALERVIMVKQQALYEEDCFEASCRLNSEIAELASAINDLHIWYRTQQDADAKLHQ
ncbi:hypothetical protein NQ117_06890 [Paenibacillus sp. SC116]|uniref:hypothetical protein n=1 Tax=Paenibacillus sp. SC116 TaxID=2968986 RepID=UPI00215AD5EE|nr:hypothetical protein [Paenibacillus sp. SC116]MCR8843404.1 hypothetical protein [Paenibacillus sp. SC116]